MSRMNIPVYDDFRKVLVLHPQPPLSPLHLVIYRLVFAKLSSVKFSASQVELRLALLSLNSPPTPPHPDKYI